jgi:hypothetical protein
MHKKCTIIGPKQAQTPQKLGNLIYVTPIFAGTYANKPSKLNSLAIMAGEAIVGKEEKNCLAELRVETTSRPGRNRDWCLGHGNRDNPNCSRRWDLPARLRRDTI